MKLHDGIRIDRIPIKDAPGLIFAVGSVTILLIGLPEVRVFLPFAAAGGLLTAILLRLTR